MSEVTCGGQFSRGILKRLIDALRDGAVVTDGHGFIRAVNQAGEEMFGFPAEQLIGQPVSMLETMHLALGSDPDLSAAIAAQGVWEGYTAGLRHDGTTFPVIMTVVSFGDVARAIDGYVVIYRSAAEGLQAMEDLRAVLYLAKSARQVRRQIVTSITHEFRTPLATIIGFSGLLDHTPDVPDAGREFVKAIRSSAERLKVLVESVIEYANIQAETTVVHSAPYPIRDRLRVFLEPVAHRLEMKRLAWKYYIDPAVPERINVDGEKLERILEFLLDNAAKFTSAGRVSLSVALAPSPKNALVFRVEDTGVGYDPRLTEQLFEPFRQGEEGLNRRFPGIGLGLALAKQLSDLLGGTLHTTTVQGVGSVFTFALPITPASDGQTSHRVP